MHESQQPLAPLRVEPRMDHAGLMINHPQRGLIAVIGSAAPDNVPAPFDAAYASLFAASPLLLAELRRVLAQSERDNIPSRQEDRHGVTGVGVWITHKQMQRLRLILERAETLPNVAVQQ